MWTILSKSSVVSRCSLVVLGIILLVFLCVSAVVNAQQPTATINSLTGQVLVSIQGKTPVIGTKGTILRAGDIIETQAGAQAVLLLSEGSELRLGQNTKIDITTLTQKTRARTSRIKLLYGKIRAILSPGHQKKGSSFTIDTPNATAGVKFSRPVIEASYDPTTETSLFKAYTVALKITNRYTRKVRQVPRGSQAIVRKESTLLSPISERAAPTRNNLVQQSRSAVRGATSTTVPLSVGVVGTGETEEIGETGGITTTETSTNPSPGTRPDNRVRPRPVTVTIRED